MVMNVMKFFVLLMLSLTLVSCGSPILNGKKTISLNKEEINQMMANQSFECASLDGSPCPDGIARVFIFNEKNPDKSSVCTGFVNGSNRLVTNNHCLSTASECNSTYVSVFYNGGHESVRCKSIIKSENDGRPNSSKIVDYTVMELDRHLKKSKPFPLSKFSPYPGERLTAWVIDHLSRTDARITELSCMMEGRTNSLELKNCPAIHGNSGAPVVNDFGEVVAVLWGSTVDEAVNGSTSLVERRILSDYALATELKYFKNYLVK